MQAPRDCAACQRRIQNDESFCEFHDFKGVFFHALCIDARGTDACRAIAADPISPLTGLTSAQRDVVLDRSYRDNEEE